MRPPRSISLALASTLAASGASAIVRGTVDPGDPAVVTVDVCSGVLVSPRVALTSRACVLGPVRFGPSRDEVTASIDVIAYAQHPTYDLGVVTLLQAAPVAPIEANGAHLLPWVGEPARIVGFGRTDESIDDSGVKRQGTATLVSLNEEEMWLDFDESAPCGGDPGGPILMSIDGVEKVVGIISYWTRFECGESSFAGVRTDSAFEWLSAYIVANEPSDPPTIAITSPRDGDSVDPLFTVSVAAADDHGVSRVELWVDDQINDRADEEPFPLTALPTLPLGPHEVEVRAYDAAGQEARAAISVIVGAGCVRDEDCRAAGHCDAGVCRHGLGASCDMHGECASGLCGVVDGLSTCTQRCGGGYGDCPSGFVCEAPLYAGGSNQCAPGTPLDGCAATRPRTPPLPGVLLLPALLLLRPRRR